MSDLRRLSKQQQNFDQIEYVTGTYVQNQTKESRHYLWVPAVGTRESAKSISFANVSIFFSKLLGRHVMPLVWFSLLRVCRSQSSTVACLTAVREVLGSNRAVGSCVYRKNNCGLQPWHGLCVPFLKCLGQLSQIYPPWDGK